MVLRSEVPSVRVRSVIVREQNTVYVPRTTDYGLSSITCHTLPVPSRLPTAAIPNPILFLSSCHLANSHDYYYYYSNSLRRPLEGISSPRYFFAIRSSCIHPTQARTGRNKLRTQ